MGAYNGVHTVITKDGRKFKIEPISEHADRGGDWGHTDLSNRPIGGAIHPDDFTITEENGYKNIIVLGPGESPYSAINDILKNEN